MIRGNERAIALGLAIMELGYPREDVPTVREIAAYCDAAREELGLRTEPIRGQDIFYIETRALEKCRKEFAARTTTMFERMNRGKTNQESRKATAGAEGRDRLEACPTTPGSVVSRFGLRKRS